MKPSPTASAAPIKTLHITNYYHSSSGGIRTFYDALLDAADRHRREVRLVVPGLRDGVEDAGAYGKIYTIKAPRSPLFDSRYRLLLPHLYALPYRSRLREILRQEQPDLVEVCDKYTLCFLPSVIRRGWIGGFAPRVVVGLSCERMDDNVSAFLSSGMFGRRYANWYMRRVYAPRFDGYVSNSDYTAGELRDALGENGRRQPVTVCPMGVQADGLGPHLRDETTRRALLGLPCNAHAARQTRLLLYVGRVSPEKNLELLLEMMERLASDPASHYRMLIAGSGPSEHSLAAMAESRAPGRFQFLGQVANRHRLAQIYANCDALVHPNPREPFGIAPLEAMASGLPLVAPRQGGVLSYANDENSWLAAPSGEAFAAAVPSVFSNDAARAAKVESALRTAHAFSWPRVTARIFEVYDDLYSRLS
jgi:alpha-1,6-mannosyltransferase